MNDFRPRQLAVPILFCAAILAGCVKIDNVLVINKDGSGRVDLTYGMSQEEIALTGAILRLADQLQSAAATNAAAVPPAALRNPFCFDENEIRRRFKPHEANGVRLDKIKVEPREMGWYAHMTVVFTNIANVVATDIFSLNALSLSKNAAGNYVLTQQVGDDSASELYVPTDEEIRNSLAPVLSGFNVSMKVSVPGAIIETSGTKVDRNSAEWRFDFDRDRHALLALQKQPMRVTFTGAGLLLPEVRHRPLKQY